MAEAFLTLSAGDRREALAVAADQSGRPPHLLEKDVWVVWTLATLFGSDLGEHLVFKGGTSLRKLYAGNQGRFSLDLDFSVANPPTNARLGAPHQLVEGRLVLNVVIFSQIIQKTVTQDIEISPAGFKGDIFRGIE